MIPSAGYSGTPLAKKLGVKPGATYRLLHAPVGWSIQDLPHDAHSTDSPGADVTVVFFSELAALQQAAPQLAGELLDTAMLWVAWPRKATGHVSDVTENDLRDLFLPTGLVDVKVAALGEDWSGLKFVRRKQLRQRR